MAWEGRKDSGADCISQAGRSLGPELPLTNTFDSAVITSRPEKFNSGSNKMLSAPQGLCAFLLTSFPSLQNSFPQDICSCGTACYFNVVIICVRRDTTAPEPDPTALGTPQAPNKTLPVLLCLLQASVPSWVSPCENEGGGTFRPGREQMWHWPRLVHHLVQTQ